MSASEDRERVITLSSAAGTSLILNYPTGIKYGNQVGGCALFHPTMEGILIPFSDDCDENDLGRLFQRPWEEAAHGIDSAIADAIDDLLYEKELLDWIRVDRTHMESSFEAWVHVVVLSDSFYCQGFGPYPRKGVLTWMNSD